MVKQDRWNVLRRFDGKTEAFILNITATNDSISLYLNKGGLGDDPDIIDSASALKGIYRLDPNGLAIKGVQGEDTLELVYEKQKHLKAKSWFW
ncbi:MAG: hypothetical protein JNL13_04745 [Chitinophagaceae bacterium]|nr:hypothetical protein [Chitinophagaceae bacterium]